ncbi:hypothetical protein Q4610_18775 [Sphingobium sp. HBC34]|uniref:Uncharacterized protein n=1 Tax=Sphingobium cyanobacteriorum TaxID=3063954 RepID=A0ABT8ZRB9_9SPHN|nr:hypothetical protein [Sphingobium sp. HBC34]MDO7837092.1 hypothetical protein [Sphingobium sp. HBC34]
MYEFALMSRFVELGKLYGLEPWQFDVEYNRQSGETSIVSRPIGHEEYAKFNDMIKALGVSEDDKTIPYEEGPEIFAALDEAIRSAPRKWAR